MSNGLQLVRHDVAAAKTAALPELAKQINGLYEIAVATAANHAMAIGELLVEAQSRVQQDGGKWQDWVEANLVFGYRNASRYLKLAKDTALVSDRTRVSDFTIPEVSKSPSLRAGLLALTPPPTPATPKTAKTPKRKKSPPSSAKNFKPLNPQALRLCGLLRDFERDGILDENLDDLLSDMPDAMRIDVLRLAPLVADWLNGVSNDDG